MITDILTLLLTIALVMAFYFYYEVLPYRASNQSRKVKRRKIKIDKTIKGH